MILERYIGFSLLQNADRELLLDFEGLEIEVLGRITHHRDIIPSSVLHLTIDQFANYKTWMAENAEDLNAYWDWYMYGKCCQDGDTLRLHHRGWIELETTPRRALQEKSSPLKGFVYLMKDTTNGFYKIGFSKNPRYRENTLQAEKPTIELIDKWEGTTSDEKDLHNRFKRTRIRGEWFYLSPADILAVGNYFERREKYAV